ncbi:Hypothetical Protein XCAW_01818 [Xanthomonas citri subsp. citri Aw12879]|nr:Hypothetical Protein XCAW_01818 [Xanthomonas citri subsp. citri Aw12879]
MHRQTLGRDQRNHGIVVLREHAEGLPQAEVTGEIRRVLRPPHAVHNARARRQIREHHHFHLAVGIHRCRGAGIAFLGIDLVGRHVLAQPFGRDGIRLQHFERFHLLAIAQPDLAELLHGRLGLEQDLVLVGFNAAGVCAHLVVGAVAHETVIGVGLRACCSAGSGCGPLLCLGKQRNTEEQHEH